MSTKVLSWLENTGSYNLSATSSSGSLALKGRFAKYISPLWMHTEPLHFDEGFNFHPLYKEASLIRTESCTHLWVERSEFREQLGRMSV